MNVKEAADWRYRTHGPTGFLKPAKTYCVLVGIEPAYVGPVKRTAKSEFKRQAQWSKLGQGKAAGKRVVLKINGETTEEFNP